MGYDFIFGWASKKICLCRPAQKRTQLEPVPHNHVGPTDTAKGRLLLRAATDDEENMMSQDKAESKQMRNGKQQLKNESDYVDDAQKN